MVKEGRGIKAEGRGHAQMERQKRSEETTVETKEVEVGL